jgi:hypothetical protein
MTQSGHDCSRRSWMPTKEKIASLACWSRGQVGIMAHRTRYVIAIGFLFVWIVSVGGSSAAAQEQFPWAKYVELTKRKGFKDFPIGRRVCIVFGLPDDGKDCVAYQAPYTERGYTHGFNVVERPNTPNVYIILGLVPTNPKAVPASQVYLVSLDGRLLAAAVLWRRGEEWSRISIVPSPDGYESEVAYWRAKVSELEGEPDRKD